MGMITMMVVIIIAMVNSVGGNAENDDRLAWKGR